MPNEIAIKVKKPDTSPIEQIGTAAKQAGKDVGTHLEKGFKEGEAAAARAGKQVEGSLDKVKAKAKETGREIADSTGGAVSGMVDNLGGAGGAFLAAGAVVGGLFVNGFAQQMEQQKIGGLLAAQTGATGAAAAQLGDTAGDVFGDNFGESIEEVGEAMKAVFQNRLIDVNANTDDIKAMTEEAMTAAQVVGEEVNNVARAAQQAVRTGLAGSVTEALDLITRGTQLGLNTSEDLLDTITEYGTQFRELGLSGPEALGLISQGMKGGARDTDVAADALKEFSIRARDGSETTVRGFETIGLSAGEMGQRIAAGGDSARNALSQTLVHLQSMENQTLRDQAAVDLFGAKAEDLGDALLNMDLSTASDEFGEFAGATEDAAGKIADATPALETAWRNIQAGVGNAFDWASESEEIDKVIASVREHAAQAKQGQQDAADAVNEGTTSWHDQEEAVVSVVETLDKFIAKQKQLASGVLELSDAEIAYQQALDDAAESAKENGRTLDTNTEKGRENREALNDVVTETYGLIEAMEAQGATTEAVSGFVAGAREQFLALADKMGLGATEANRLADKLGLIPGTYEAKVTADVSAAETNLRRISGFLAELLRPKTVTVSAVPGSGFPVVSHAHGGVVGAGMPHAAAGGPRSNQIVAGEHGIEIIDVAPGSTVHSAPDSKRMLAGSGDSGPMVVEFHFPPGGSTIEQLLAALWQKGVRDGLINAYAGGQRVQVR